MRTDDAPGVRDLAVDWTQSHDALSSFVEAAGLRGLILADLELGAPWWVRNPPSEPPVLHFVVKGKACLREDPNSESIRLESGDVVMLPSGGKYELLDDIPSFAREPKDPSVEGGQAGCSVRVGGDGPKTTMMCYAYRFRDGSALALLRMLPRRIIVRAPDGPAGLRPILGELARETKLLRLATDGIVSRLAEVAYLSVLRHHFDTTESTGRGLLAAIADPHVGPALQAVHASLATPWTVAKLAAVVGLSRAAFSRLFAERTGDSPMHYVQRMRVHSAARMMTDPSLSLAEVGQRVGYADPAAFSRAFRREMDVSPRDYRRRLSSS